jgi:hypothetical protein
MPDDDAPFAVQGTPAAADPGYLTGLDSPPSNISSRNPRQHKGQTIAPRGIIGRRQPKRAAALKKTDSGDAQSASAIQWPVTLVMV